MNTKNLLLVFTLLWIGSLPLSAQVLVSINNEFTYFLLEVDQTIVVKISTKTIHANRVNFRNTYPQLHFEIWSISNKRIRAKAQLII